MIIKLKNDNFCMIKIHQKDEDIISLEDDPDLASLLDDQVLSSSLDLNPR